MMLFSVSQVSCLLLTVKLCDPSLTCAIPEHLRDESYSVWSAIQMSCLLSYWLTGLYILTRLGLDSWVKTEADTSCHQEGQTNLDFSEARDDGVAVDHVQIICTSLHRDNAARTSSLNFLQAGCSSWYPTSSVKAQLRLRVICWPLLVYHYCFFWLLFNWPSVLDLLQVELHPKIERSSFFTDSSYRPTNSGLALKGS